MVDKVGHYNNLTINVREYMLCIFNVWMRNFTSLIQLFSKKFQKVNMAGDDRGHWLRFVAIYPPVTLKDESAVLREFEVER